MQGYHPYFTSNNKKIPRSWYFHIQDRHLGSMQINKFSKSEIILSILESNFGCQRYIFATDSVDLVDHTSNHRLKVKII